VRNIHGIRNLLYRQPQRSLLPEEHHGTTWVGRRTADAIRRSRTRPFFIWAGWIAPHPPFAPPAELADLYKDADIPEPLPMPEKDHPNIAGDNQVVDAATPEKIDRIRRLYYANITHVDKAIGMVLEALEEIDQLDNTLIVFTSDHGEMLGDCGRWSKSQPHDSSVRVPFIVRWPQGFEPGSVRHDFVDNLDILPTVLDACGIEYPSEIDLPGESLLRAPGTGIRRRDEHYMENAGNGRRKISLRTKRYKYNYWFSNGLEELYDLEADPHELTNLLDGEVNEETESVRRRLHGRLSIYEARYGTTDGSLEPWGEEHKEHWPPGPYTPSSNWQFHMHPFNMSPEEAARYTAEHEEVLQATAEEPTVNVLDLDLDYYESAGGDEELRRKLQEESP
jgi:arylsulfatase A-like enzyme